MALKLAPPGLRHKSEAGALRLDLRTRRRGAGRLSRALGLARGRRRARVLVERMAPPGVELLVAARADAVVPALVVGLGGIWTEALDDVAIVPLPADAERVEAAIRSLRGAAALGGGRGRERSTSPSAAALAAAVGSLLLERGSTCSSSTRSWSTADGCVALDALGRRAPRDGVASLTL